MKPSRFRYLAPTSVAEAVEALTSYEDSKVLAGGQSLGPLMNLRLSNPDVLIDLGAVSELAAPPGEGSGVLTVAAMTRQRTVETSPLVRRLCPLLAQALPYVAHRTIRNRGTVGGSLAHADPAAELPAVAVACGATLKVEGPGGPRSIRAGEFFEGFFTTTLGPAEIVVAVDFPQSPRREGTSWVEFAPRRGDFALVGVAARVALSEEGAIESAKLVYSGVADSPYPAPAAGASLEGRRPSPANFEAAAAQAAGGCRPIGDLTGSSEYRRNLMQHLAVKALTEASERATGRL